MKPREARTDPHRPGVIVPADYGYVRSYNLATTFDGWPIPSWGVNCELDGRHEVDGKLVTGAHSPDGVCCIVGMRRAGKRFVGTGATGVCSICSTPFVYGDVWEHEPSGDLLHVGHICADKYSLLADRSAFELEMGRKRRAAAASILAESHRAERSAFLEAHPGLAEALKTEHPIVSDIADRFRSYRSLSEKQVALVMKLAHEAANPKAAEPTVPVPALGRVEFEGEVVSVKYRDTNFGPVPKMTVKVTTPEGVWLAWGTCPDAIVSSGIEARNPDGGFAALRGALVRVRATLKAGRDPYFALMSRPTGKLLSLRAA